MNLNKHISNLSLKVSLNASNLSLMEKSMIASLMKLQSSITYKNFTIAKLSSKLNVSSTSLHRVSKKLGYSSFTLFKEDFFNMDNDESKDFSYNNNMFSDINDTIKMASKGISDEVVDLIINSKRIVIYAMGVSNSIADIFRIKLRFEGFNVENYYDSRFMKLSASSLKKDEDVIIILSRSGYPPELIEVMKQANLIGVKSILITEAIGSLIEDMSSFTIRTAITFDSGNHIDTRLQTHIAFSMLVDKVLSLKKR